MRVTSLLIFLLLGRFGSAKEYDSSIRGGIRNDVDRYEKLKRGYISCPICADEIGKMFMYLYSFDFYNFNEFNLADDDKFNSAGQIRACNDPDSTSSLTYHHFAYDDTRCVKLELYEIDSSVPTGRVGQIRLSYTMLLQLSKFKIPGPVPPGLNWKFERSPHFLLNVTTCDLPEVECFTADLHRYHKEANFPIPERPDVATTQTPTLSPESLHHRMTDAERTLKMREQELAESQKKAARFENSTLAAQNQVTHLQIENRELRDNLTMLINEKEGSFEPNKEWDEQKSKAVVLTLALSECQVEVTRNRENIMSLTSAMKDLENELAETRVNHTAVSEEWESEKSVLEKKHRLSENRTKELLGLLKDCEADTEQRNFTITYLQTDALQNQNNCSKQIENYEVEVESLRDDIRKLNDDVKKYREDSQKHLETIHDFNQHTDDVKSGYRKIVENHILALGTLEDEKQQISEEFKALNSSLLEQLKEVGKCHSDFESVQNELKLLTKTNQTLTEQLLAVNVRVTGLETEHATAKENFEITQDSVKRLEKLLESANMTLTEKEFELDVCRANSSLEKEMNTRMHIQLEALKAASTRVALQLSDGNSCSILKIALVTICVFLTIVLIILGFVVFKYRKPDSLPSPENSGEGKPTDQPNLPLDHFVWMQSGRFVTESEL